MPKKHSVDVKGLSDKALAGLIRRANAEQQQRAEKREAEEKKGKEARAARQEVEALLKGKGLTIGDIVDLESAKAPKKPKVPREPKYQHPDDPKITWHGRGPRPKWIQEYWEEHGNINALLIEKK